MKQLFSAIVLSLCCATFLSGCEMWYVSAARAAKKRESQTGPIMGEIQQATGVDDPLGRKQGSIDGTADAIGDKMDSAGDKVDNIVDSI